MEYQVDVINVESDDFPFNIFDGAGSVSTYLHAHDCLELNYVISGTGHYIIGENTYYLSPGDFVVINNCEYHIAIDEQDLLLKVIVFHPEMVWQHTNAMDYKYLKTFFEWKKDFKHHFKSSTPFVKKAKELFYEMEDEFISKKDGYQLIIKAMLLNLLALMYREFVLSEDTAEEAIRFHRYYNKLLNAVTYIDNHYCENIELTHMAELAHLSPNYFSKLFNNIMNMSLSRYINEKRIGHACLLLTTTEKNICEIALNSGYNDIAHFNKTFKEIVKSSPSLYRKSNKI